MEITEHGKKKQKLSDEEKDMPSFDRLSALPDSILLHILSFLTAKHSVATSILARRWTFLWTEVSTLDFDDEFHSSRTSFAEFINSVLLLHKLQNINTFHLSHVAENLRSDYEALIWIATAISRNVRNLHIFFDDQYVRLPRCLFTCKTLVNLTLKSCTGIPMTGTICLPNLKTLHLYCIKYETDENFQHLFSGCPVLEELEIVNNDDLGCCHISSLTIKRLTIEFLFHNFRMPDEYKLEINAPALRHLDVSDYLLGHISAENLNSLTEACISLDICEITADYDRTLSMLNTVYNLSNVKRLKLLPGDTKLDDLAFADSRFGSSTLRFDNLINLEVVADWRFLIRFLEISDNLEVLIIHKVHDKNLNCWKEPQQAPCLSHLKSITIDGFAATEHEFQMIRYFLKNAKVLMMMNIHCDSLDCNAENTALKRISRFPRGSELCELDFC